MNQAIGNALLFNIIITIVIILIAFFVGSLSYTKAFKVKNRVIEEIEKNQTYDNNVKAEIEKWLAGGGTNGEGIGYKRNTTTINNKTYCPDVTCPKGTKATCGLINQTSDYQYCVYEFDTCVGDKSICGKYYRVVTYMYFDFPVINELLRIPVTGETMIFQEINS